MKRFYRVSAVFVWVAVWGVAEAQTASREAELLERVRRLEERLAAMEARLAVSAAAPAAAADVAGAPVPVNAPAGPLADTTFSAGFDGYYGYNFNQPAGRVNLLRAYDVSSNSFAINQVGLIVERAPDPAAGRRFGARVDLMFGQATETLQGGAQNELRPQVWRNVYQAYGSYVVPVGRGLTVDFGKFAGTLGYEGNYTKDQINYSRGYWFNFLPFYHTGFHTTYAFNDRFSVTNWLVNGAQQTEDFNGFKSAAFIVNLKPARRVSWTVNYYTGQEQRDTVPALNPGLPALPTQPGLSVTPVRPAPDGRFHVMDTYASWNAGERLLLVGELDTVVNRVFRSDAPSRATGGAAYARYQFTRRFSAGGRLAVLNDRGGIFSGLSQTLKDTTITGTYQLADGFQTKVEFRRDFSNAPFFLTSTPGVLKKEQSTAMLGLIWWFGSKEGAW